MQKTNKEELNLQEWYEEYMKDKKRKDCVDKAKTYFLYSVGTMAFIFMMKGSGAKFPHSVYNDYWNLSGLFMLICLAFLYKRFSIE